MATERQNADGSVSILREQDQQDLCRIGGYAGPAGSNIPRYNSGAILEFNVAGGTDSAGGLLSWQNNLGYDILITAFQFDVTTIAAAACTASFGATATSGTTLSSNLMNGQDVHSASGQFNGGALSVKVPAGKWLTGSTASGASSGLVGMASFAFKPQLGPGSK